MSGEADVQFQYTDAADERQTSLAGMWLLLASEMLFFGGLFLLWLYYRVLFPEGFAEATAHTEITIGTANTLILLTSSTIYASGILAARLGRNRVVVVTGAITLVLGLTFTVLKFYEWYKDIQDGMIPGPRFALHGPNAGGAQLFWEFYYIGTVLHIIHLVIGLGLVTWVVWKSRRRTFIHVHATPVEVVGLYWSFVDMVWMVLYALIYPGPRSGG
jgi:cytochrome c oxidase subunit 3